VYQCRQGSRQHEQQSILETINTTAMNKQKRDVLVNVIQAYREHIFKLENAGIRIEYAAVDKLLAGLQTHLK